MSELPNKPEELEEDNKLVISEQPSTPEKPEIIGVCGICFREFDRTKKERPRTTNTEEIFPKKSEQLLKTENIDTSHGICQTCQSFYLEGDEFNGDKYREIMRVGMIRSLCSNECFDENYNFDHKKYSGLLNKTRSEADGCYKVCYDKNGKLYPPEQSELIKRVVKEIARCYVECYSEENGLDCQKFDEAVEMAIAGELEKMPAIIEQAKIIADAEEERRARERAAAAEKAKTEENSAE